MKANLDDMISGFTNVTRNINLTNNNITSSVSSITNNFNNYYTTTQTSNLLLLKVINLTWFQDFQI